MTGNRKQFTKLIFAGIYLGAALLLLIQAYAAIPLSDEGYFSSPAHNLAQHGHYGTTVLETAGTKLLRMEQRTYWVFPLYQMLQAGWITVGGPESLFGVRAMNLMALLMSLGAFAVFLRSAGLPAAESLVGASLLATSFQYQDTFKLARPDAWCQAFGWMALASYAYLRERSLNQSLLAASFCLGLSMLTHPNAVIYATSLAVLILYWDRKQLTLKGLAGAALVQAMIYAPWILYILQDTEAFWAQIFANNQSRWIQSLNPLVWLGNELYERYFASYGLLSEYIPSRLKGVVLIAQFGAVAYCLLSRELRERPVVRILLLLWGTTIGIQMVYNQKLTFYLVHILPLYSACLAVVLVQLYKRKGPPVMRGAIVAIGLGLCTLQVYGLLKKTHQWNWSGTQQEITGFLDSNAGDATWIHGDACFLHALHYDPRLVEDRFLGLKSGKQSDVLLLAEHLLVYTHYGALKQADPAVFARITARYREYETVFVRPGFRILFRKTLLPVKVSDDRSKWKHNEFLKSLEILGWK